MNAVLDRQEQYSRCDCLLIHKVDTDELSIKVIKEHMNQKIEPEDIDRSHRLGNPKKSVKLDLDPL